MIKKRWDDTRDFELVGSLLLEMLHQAEFIQRRLDTLLEKERETRVNGGAQRLLAIALQDKLPVTWLKQHLPSDVYTVGRPVWTSINFLMQLSSKHSGSLAGYHVQLFEHNVKHMFYSGIWNSCGCEGGMVVYITISILSNQCWRILIIKSSL